METHSRQHALDVVSELWGQEGRPVETADGDLCEEGIQQIAGQLLIILVQQIDVAVVALRTMAVHLKQLREAIGLVIPLQVGIGKRETIVAVRFVQTH